MKILINGGRPLSGEVRAEGAKNAVLPILAACLLAEEPVTLREVPPLDDVLTISGVLHALGLRIEPEGGNTLHIEPALDLGAEAPEDMVRRMRASFLVLGPLLARLGEARIALPGGCAIGTRPIDLHLKGLEALGAELVLDHGCIHMRARRLRGDRIYLDFPSVGATENILMAATMAEGTTIIENAAEEPEVVDLANFLTALGARVRGAGSKVIRVEGVPRLGGAEYSVVPDRIEAGTFLAAAAITEGDVWVTNALPEHVKAVTAKRWWRSRLRTALREGSDAPRVYTVLEYAGDGDRLWAARREVTAGILRLLGARVVEGVDDGGLYSVTAYSPRLPERLQVAGRPVNANVALHWDSQRGKTVLWLGSPVINVEY